MGVKGIFNYWWGFSVFFWGVGILGGEPPLQKIAGINTVPRSAVRLDGAVLINKYHDSSYDGSWWSSKYIVINWVLLWWTGVQPTVIFITVKLENNHRVLKQVNIMVKFLFNTMWWNMSWFIYTHVYSLFDWWENRNWHPSCFFVVYGCKLQNNHNTSLNTLFD